MEEHSRTRGQNDEELAYAKRLTVRKLPTSDDHYFFKVVPDARATVFTKRVQMLSQKLNFFWLALSKINPFKFNFKMENDFNGRLNFSVGVDLLPPFFQSIKKDKFSNLSKTHCNHSKTFITSDVVLKEFKVRA